MANGISVIIPTFNRFALLRTALCGLLMQKEYRAPLEIILVDNGSDADIGLAMSDLQKHLNISIVRRYVNCDHFRPGSARNLGVMRANYEIILFLDSDCVPSEYFLKAHWVELSSHRNIATIGHRVFIDRSDCSESIVLASPSSLSALTGVRSASNYLAAIDRRMPELVELSRHPAPYNCVHGCNVGVRKETFVESGMFDLAFDGNWGYEDIEWGFRLHRVGVEFVYLPQAFVYHLEGDGLSLEERLSGSRINFGLACAKIPSYAAFRRELGR